LLKCTSGRKNLKKSSIWTAAVAQQHKNGESTKAASGKGRVVLSTFGLERIVVELESMC
jgi:hypothetical protein